MKVKVQIGRWHLLLIVSVAACNQQREYTHNPEQFTKDDQWAVGMVQKSPLGKPSIMRGVVANMVDSSGGSAAPLVPCYYLVSKIVERNRHKHRDGTYPVHYHVSCLTGIPQSNQPIFFGWDVSDSGYGVTTFEWGWQDDR